MSIARKILENTFVQVIGKVVTAGLSIIVLKIISGYLGTAGYGDYTTVYQFLAFFGIAADFGIYTITVKEMSKDESRIPMILGNILGLRTGLAILAMVAAVVVAFLIPSYADTVIPMGVLVATMATIFTLLNGTVSSVLQVHLKMQYATIGLVIGKIVSVIYMAVVAYVLFTGDLVNGFYHLMWAGVLGNLVMFGITLYYVLRYTKITYRFDFSFWKKMFITSLPYGVALMLNTMYFRLDVILMTVMLPHTTLMADGTSQCSATMCGDTEVGLYGVAMRFLEMLVIIPIYFMNSVLPVMTRFIEEQSQRIKELMQYSFDFLVATGIPILVGGFVLAVPIIMFISDSEFVSGNEYVYGSDVAVRILMFAMLFSFINSLFGFTLVVLNKQMKLMIINAGCVLFNMIANLIAIPYWGFRGASITSVFSELFILILISWTAKKALGFKLSSKTLLKIILSATVMGIFVSLGFYWMQDIWFIWQLALLVPLGGIVYVIMILRTKAVTPDMWKLLKKS
ncbi:flippase [Candidatus Peregrinibacteria bacterium]|nr:flippase [Candidatus Peregrinibacteria bacterium]